MSGAGGATTNGRKGKVCGRFEDSEDLGKYHWLFESTIDPLSAYHCSVVFGRIQDQARPRGSLGQLEKIAVQIGGIQKSQSPSVKKRVLLIFCGDHGVAEENVSLFPPSTTVNVINIVLNDDAAVNTFAREVNCDFRLVDVGVSQNPSKNSLLLNKKIARGTSNIRNGPAMVRESAFKSLATGCEVASQFIRSGYRALALGEIGNSNTTIASALLSALLDWPPEKTVGYGTGISESVYRKKLSVVQQAICANRPNPADPLECLQKVGGLELGAIAGACIGGAIAGVPCVIDGFISTVAALLAVRLRPEVRDYLVFSHVSGERCHRALLDELNADPVLDLGMCLGEGTGALASMPVLDLACSSINEIATFRDVSTPDPHK